MSRPGIPYQAVIDAASELQGRALNPTVDRVRELLKTGSKSTIARYLKAWKSEPQEPGNGYGIPPELQALVKGLWDRIHQAASEKIAVHEQNSQQVIEQLQTMVQQSEQKNVVLQNELASLRQQLSEKATLIEEFRNGYEEEKRQKALLTDRQTSLTSQLAEQKSENERLHQLLMHVQANLEHYQSSIQQLQQEQELSREKQKNAYEQALSAVKKECGNLVGFNHKLQQNAVLWETKHQAALEQYELMLAEKNHYFKELQEKIIQENSLLHSFNQLEQTCRHHQQVTNEKSNAITVLEIKLADLSEQSEQLALLNKLYLDAQTSITRLNHEKLTLVKEKAHLEGQLRQPLQ